MSVAEMKVKAVNYLTTLQSESAVKEVLEHLERLKNDEVKVVNLSQHYDAIKAQYGDVLEKLAQ